MKFQALLATFLFGSAVTQYTTNTVGTTLPTVPSVNTYVPAPVDNVAVPDFPTADVLKLTLGSTDRKSTEKNIRSTIGEASQQLSTPVNSFESLFTRHPSKSELTTFADDGDTAAISRTLQNLASDDSVPCQAKVSYLLELLGQIKAAIARKNLAADQLQAIIDGARAEIARLQSEIARVQNARTALYLPDLNKRVNDIVARLRPLYDQINAVKDQIPPEEARIAGFEKEIATLTKINDGERNRQSNDRLKLTQTDNLLKDLYSQLADAQAQKAALEASIAASQALISDNNNKIANLRNTIAEIQAKIKNLKDLLDRLRRDANTLEVDEQRARTDLSVAQARDKAYLDEIRGYQDRINDQQPKLVEDELIKIRTLIDNLNRSVPEVQGQLDREYYYCYGAGRVDTIKTGDTVVYVVRGEAFGKYIQNAYGQNVNVRNQDYRLRVIDPFSDLWTSKFGYPWAVGGNSRFSCLANGGNSGWGTIRSIKGGEVTVNQNGSDVKLNLGGCSRFESASEVPRVGQQLAWRGVPSSVGGYNIYSATCWE